ncbi:uncharacterized protein B0I36DRAFT_394628 [Microdochium trichocladiopsis]|uniref:Zn(2)-C6 fungal-type domain-containing protein n=1 Tax=Microdochium trichocladiopsis TaxID=1682393 RepID=A0A9P9BK31_9PEZI|nr:uncharacterized protein B0I36DRAFT_394628 [Microdochium trichocladiopsis]KAH7018031.1 hypothetical protein B0I36DRAFT_394628 [Microdochium trichocladiopsis]
MAVDSTATACLNANSKRTSLSPSPPAAAHAGTDPALTSTAAGGDRPYQKRIRLSLACNQCRKRKVRCDTTLPKCRNCVQRNEHCETSDLRRPDHGPGVRALAIKDGNQQARQQAPPQQGQPRSWDDDGRDGSIADARDDDGGLTENDADKQHQRPAPPRRTQSQSSHHSKSSRPPAGTTTSPSPRSQREPSHAATSTPDSRSHRHASESATSANGSTSEAPNLSWVQRAYRVAASGTHGPDGSGPNGSSNSNAGGGGVGGVEGGPENLNGSTPDVVVNTDDTAYRVKFVGGSSLQCLCTFVDLHLVSKGLRPVSPGFKQGMQYSEEFELPLTPHLPPLPVRPETDGYVAAFMRRVWPLYPVVDETTVAADIDYIMQVQALHGERFARHLPQLTLPTLAVTYAVLALGSAELAGQATPLSTSYLTAAYSLYGHLIALPYTVSVQALFLMALALRAQMRDGQAWQVLGQALRIAYSIGLHRTSPSALASSSQTNQKMNGAKGRGQPQQQPQTPRRPPPGCSPSYTSDAGLHSRLWWSCYALERLVQLESGRPAVVHDRVGDGISNIDSDTYNNNNNEHAPPPRLPQMLDPATHGSEYFVAWVSLAHIMGKISDQFYGQKPRDSVELFTRVYRLDQMLTEWKDTLPDSVRLRKDAVARASRHAAAARQARHDRHATTSSRSSNNNNNNNNNNNKSSSGGEDSGDEEEDDDDYPPLPGTHPHDASSSKFEYQHHLASFLSLQHYQAHITLLRIALIFPHADFLAEIAKQREHLPRSYHYGGNKHSGLSAHSRLVNGADICLGAARSVITEATTLADDAERSVLLGANPMFVSAMVLALGILRQPTRRLARADLQLFHLALELVEEYLSRWVVMGGPSGSNDGGTGAGQEDGDEEGVVTSGGGGDGGDMMGLVALLRDQIDAYHTHFRTRGAAAATMASMSGAGGGGGKASPYLHQQQQQQQKSASAHTTGSINYNSNNSGDSTSHQHHSGQSPYQDQRRSSQTGHGQAQYQHPLHQLQQYEQSQAQHQQQHLMGPQGFSASHFTSSSSATPDSNTSTTRNGSVGGSSSSNTNNNNNNDMPPPPLPGAEGFSNGAEGVGVGAGQGAGGGPGTPSQVFSPSGLGSAGGGGGGGGTSSLSALLTDGGTTVYDHNSHSMAPFMDGSMGYMNGSAGSGMGGAGSTLGGFMPGSTPSSMMMMDVDSFEGLAFDELWNMIGTTDGRGEYAF